MLQKYIIKHTQFRWFNGIYSYFYKNCENFYQKVPRQNFALFLKSEQKCFSRNSLFLTGISRISV